MLQAVALTNFRNIASAEVNLSTGLNIFTGPNAQGKSNLLEAIHILSTTKSFRGSRDVDLIRFGEATAYVGGGDIEVGIEAGNKILRLRGKLAKAAEVLGEVRTVLFSPQDMQLLSGPPSGRRAYLDELISRIDRKYLLTLITYTKTLKQRNKLLFFIREGRGHTNELTSWDELLVRDGVELTKRRLQVVEELQTELASLAPELVGEKQLQLKYLSRVQPKEASPEAIRDQFVRCLSTDREHDINATTTAVGPHRDDFELVLDGRSLGRFGSRGQQRAGILALKLAEVRVNEHELGSRPTLLLDDVLSELDEEHQQKLLQEATKQQTLLTTTSTSSLAETVLKGSTIFTVTKGSINVV